MQLRLLFFGVLSEAITPEIPAWSVDGPVTVAGIRASIAAEHPAAAERIRGCAVAVNQSYSDDGRLLTEGDEVAFLPPVSGG